MARYLTLNWAVRLCIGLMAMALALLAQWLRPEFVGRLDEGLRDGFVRLTATNAPETRLTVIDINEASLAEVGPWPWPRQRVADLVEILLSHYGARLVGLDVVFPKPADARGDDRLALLAAHAPIAFAQIFDYTPRSATLHEGALVGGRPADTGPVAVPAYGFIANHQGLAGARCTGNIGFVPDADGVIRRLPVLTRFESRDYAQFAEVLLHCGSAGSSHQTGASTAGMGAGLPGTVRVAYGRSLAAYTVIPAADVLRQTAPKDLMEGRIVLVGSSALGLGDRVSTPLTPLGSGVMVHAAQLSGLLDRAAGRTRQAWSGQLGSFAWSLLSIALAVVFLAKKSAFKGLLLLAGLVLGWLAIGFTGVAWAAEWSITAPLWAYFFLLLTAVPFEWRLAQSRSRRLLNSFSHYVAKPVLDEIVRLDLQHSLEPTLREVTVLIADMEGYTRATSSLSLEQAASLTKDFLGCLTRPVLGWHGTLDKYTGDGLVAFWGAPLDSPDQADRAVSAALEILTEVAAFNALRVGSGLAPVQVRMGIESGSALVGDLGTPFRSTYTAVGDCINFASRLEAAARDLPTQLVIGAATNARLQQHRTIPLGEIALRGTQTTIEVFTVPT